MSRLLLLAHLNCDHVLTLSDPLKAGSRPHYRDHGRRLGGGAANTGLGLVWAGHEVMVATRLGRDDVGDWLLAQAQAIGLDCHWVQRCDEPAGEVLLLVDSQGERTILRQPRDEQPMSPLPQRGFDCLYVNHPGMDVVPYMQSLLAETLVVAQYPKGGAWQRPCHVMIASHSDLAASGNLWQHARDLAGESLLWLVLTEGRDGALAIRRDGETVRVAAEPVEVVDSTGAGDAFAAGLLDGLMRGIPMAQALQEAVSWGALAVAADSSLPPDTLKKWLEQRG